MPEEQSYCAPGQHEAHWPAFRRMLERLPKNKVHCSSSLQCVFPPPLVSTKAQLHPELCTSLSSPLSSHFLAAPSDQKLYNMLYMFISIFILNVVSAWAAPMCSLRSSSSAASTPTAAAAGAVSSSAPSSSGNSSAAVSDIVATTWYAGYSSDFLAPSDIPWDKYTQVTYAFGCVSYPFTHKKAY